MTREEIIDNNALIAAFMGDDVADNFNYAHITRLWLIITYIESLGYSVRIFTHSFTIVFKEKTIVAVNKNGHKISMVYEGVVQFIHWYNKQKK